MKTLGTRSAPPRLARIIVVPDPQYATAVQPDMFAAQVDYIIAANPDLVLLVGDLTDGVFEYPQNWAIVASQLARLTAANVPWAAVPGNHDYTPLADRTTLVNSFLTTPAWLTPMEAGHVENSYGLLTMAGRDYLLVNLEWSPRTAVVAWASNLAATYPSRVVILVTHCYLYWDGTRYDWAAKGLAQAWNPHAPGMQSTPSEGISDGEDLWQSLVLTHSNIRLVFCGHAESIQSAPPEVNYKTDVRPDGSLCQQLICNYLGTAPWGGGWLCEYELDENNSTIRSWVYSPYYARNRSDAASQFILAL
jgi:hypothetical protein